MIEKEQAKYFGKIDERQGITRNPEVTVTQRLGSARYYIDSRQGPQTATETQLFQQADQAAEKAIMESKNWLNTDWENYVSEMKKVQLDIWE